MRTRPILTTLAVGLAGLAAGAGISAAAATPGPNTSPATVMSQMPTGMGGAMAGMQTMHSGMANGMGDMNAMHAQMLATLPADQRAAMDAMHNQMHPTAPAPGDNQPSTN